MANRRGRSPGQLRQFDETARIGGVPDFAVNTGQGFEALAKVAGSLSGKLGQLADQAAQREGALAGLTNGARSGAAYLSMQASQAAASAKAGRLTPEQDAIITAAALRHGVDPAFLKRTAVIESGGDPNAVSSTGAEGIFQFTSGTAKDYGLTNRRDVAASADAAARLAADNASYLRNALGREPTPGELYLAHQQGKGGAAALLSNPTRAASDVVGRQAVSVNGGGVGMTAGQFAGLWTKKFADLDNIGAGAPSGPVKGLIAPGNIDLAHRPIVDNADGSISTVRSISFEEDGKEILVPTVSPEGKILSDDQAIDLYHRTGAHLGIFDNADDATAYAQKLHQSQSQYYRGRSKQRQPASPPAQTLPTLPMQLRRDGTIYGEAYDRAATSAYAWRMQAGLSTAMEAAFEANQDDPAALAAALSQVHDQFAKDQNLSDPQLAETFAKGFAQRSEAYIRAAQSKAETKMRGEERAAAFEGMAAQRSDIERQAFALGGNPEGDRLIGQAVDRAGRSIDAAVSAGAITPLEGAKQKQDLATSSALARARGTYEALPTPEAKGGFAQGMLDDWTAGKGPLAKLPFDKVKALSTTLWADARRQINEAKDAHKVEAAQVKGLIRDDVSSIEATGKGLDPKESGLDADRVSSLLGPEGLDDWQAKRDLAQKAWASTAGMETDTPDEITERLATLQPQPGQPGFAESEKIFEAAQKKAKAIVEARTKDPADAAESAFPQVREMATSATPDNPDSMQALVSARLQAEDALGIPELARQPLTGKEAVALARAVTAEPDPAKQAKAMKDLATQVEAVYGPHGEEVMRQIIQVKGIDRETAAYGAQIFSRLDAGNRPSNGDRRQGAVLTETGKADAAGQGKASDAFPLPNYKQMQMLLSHPELADRYDQKFGPGASKKILNQSSSASHYQVPEGTVDIAPDGSESFTPNE